MVTYATIMSSKMLSETTGDIKSNDSVMTVTEQQNKKPAIDDVICHYLEGNTLKNALNFINYIRDSKMKIKWSAANVWSVRYKNMHVLDIVVRQDSWTVRLVLDNAASRSIFRKRDAQYVENLTGLLKASMSAHLEPTPAMS